MLTHFVCFHGVYNAHPSDYAFEWGLQVIKISSNKNDGKLFDVPLKAPKRWGWKQNTQKKKTFKCTNNQRHTE